MLVLVINLCVGWQILGRAWKTVGSVIWTIPSHHGACILLFQFTFFFFSNFWLLSLWPWVAITSMVGRELVDILYSFKYWFFLQYFASQFFKWFGKRIVWKYWYENFLIFQICFEGKSLDGLCSGLFHKPWENHSGDISLDGR